MKPNPHIIRVLCIVIGLATLWFEINTFRMNIEIMGNLSLDNIYAILFGWPAEMSYFLDEFFSNYQSFGFWSYFFYLVNFSSPVLAIFLAQIRNDDSPLDWPFICLIFPFALLIPAVLPKKYVNINLYSESCDSCGQSGEITSYIWKTGKMMSSEVVGVEKTGNMVTTTRQVTYGDIRPLSTHLCNACYSKKLNLRRAMAFLIVLVTMSVLISNYNNITQGVFAGFYLLLLAPILTGYMISQWKHFRKRNIEFHPDIFKFYAKRKLLSMGSDTLWDYDEYRKLKAA